MFGDPKLYAKAFPHSWEAETFLAGKYDLLSFTPVTLHLDYKPKHLDYKPKHLPTYAQAAGSGRNTKTKKGRQASAPEVVRKEDD